MAKVGNLISLTGKAKKNFIESIDKKKAKKNRKISRESNILKRRKNSMGKRRG
jgi:predicted transcriptional regulator